MLEVVAVTFDDVRAAEHQLSHLRAVRDFDWLGEVSVIERDRDGRYSVKAKNPSLTNQRAVRGAAIGGLTGLFVGAIGGPLGLVQWSDVGALTGSATGASGENAFTPLVVDFEARLTPDASMLVFVGETPAVEALVAGTTTGPDAIMRRRLTTEQAEELSKVAA
jgi:uncharacterized membrane protein